MTILTKLVIAVAVGCKYSSCGQLKNVNTRKKVVEGLRHNCFHGAWTSESCLKNRGLIDPSIMGFFWPQSALFGYLSGFYLKIVFSCSEQMGR